LTSRGRGRAPSPRLAPRRRASRTIGSTSAAPVGPLPPEAIDAILEAEPLQATAVLCMAACYCGGVLEVANGDGEPTRYSPEGVTRPSPGTRQGPLPPTPVSLEAIPPPTAESSEAIPPSSPGTPEASPPPSPQTPEAVPTRSSHKPEVNATPSPGSEEACSRATPGAADPGPPASPRTLEAVSADAAGDQKLPQSSAGTPEVAASEASPHAKVRRPSRRRVCCMCGAVSEQKFQVCTGCKRAAYCGRACQAAHWPVHKIECRS
jgi:hypothetical protein